MYFQVTLVGCDGGLKKPRLFICDKIWHCVLSFVHMRSFYENLEGLYASEDDSTCVTGS